MSDRSWRAIGIHLFVFVAMAAVTANVRGEEAAVAEPASHDPTSQAVGTDPAATDTEPPFTEETEPGTDTELDALAGMSIEELLSIPVTSVQGTAHEWFRSPSAIYVITAEDIRRSGHLTLAEALRLAPGMFVGRVDSNTWRIGPRGFTGSDISATKNLVLLDGRVVYDPLFSGTFWEVQDVVLEDLDRIEVIRGPGATLWGANAVNGVINVITKSARDTQGLYITGGGGDPHRGFSDVRYGGKLSDDVWYRVWSQYDNWDDFETVAGASNHEDWSVGRLGFRLDGEGADNTTWMFKAEGYNSFTYGETARLPVPMASLVFLNRVDDGRVSGGHMQFRIEHEATPDSGWSFQTYYDRTNRVQAAGLEVNRDTFDAELRHYFGWAERQDLLWGARFNVTSDSVEDGPTISLDPGSDTHYLVSGFIQNTTELIDKRLYAMIGTKLEHNDYTGVEAQPSARLWWTPNERHTVWGAVSRAVRVPSRLERDSTLLFANIDEGLLNGDPPTGTIVPLTLSGDDDLDAEELLAYESGYRVRVTTT